MSPAPSDSEVTDLRQLAVALRANTVKLRFFRGATYDGGADTYLTQLTQFIDAVMPMLGPVQRSDSETAELASFGVDRKRVWILKFEDADRGDMFFDREVPAHAMYEKASVTWNCTLLETSERKYDIVRGKLVPLSSAFAQQPREALDRDTIATLTKQVLFYQEQLSTRYPCPGCDGHAEIERLRTALELIFAVGDGWGRNTEQEPRGTTGEGHARCREIARRALAPVEQASNPQ
jgi:hypothetical protein